MKIDEKIIADENIPFVKEAFSGFGKVITVSGREINKSLLADASILLVRSVTKVDKELLEGSSVKLVASSTVGVDHVDTDYLRENSIGFVHAPGSSAESVAEYVITSIMHIAEKCGKNLKDMTLGIIGVGNIGSKVFRMAETLGIRCLLNDPPKKRLTGSDIYVSLDETLAKSDIITLHVPLNIKGEDPTIQMVNSQFVSRMKKNAVLINTSRGKVVDEISVMNGIDSLGGVVFDVWENEPSINKKMLKLADIGTPHVAGHSCEGKLRGTKMIYDGVCAYFFKKEEWNLPEGSFTDVINEIDVSLSDTPVRDAIFAAYNIAEDSERFKEKMSLEDVKVSDIFDKLRKEYKHRHEFSRYLVRYDRKQKDSADILVGLGFQVAPVKK
ncbi:MAG: 4-phosphoerythronate dehydrogenase [Fibrobacter sp.]|nr:4-phosphoerythronate dehydrogenase [Fibrobacter sp.]